MRSAGSVYQCSIVRPTIYTYNVTLDYFTLVRRTDGLHTRSCGQKNEKLVVGTDGNGAGQASRWFTQEGTELELNNDGLRGIFEPQG